jgi:uncharacterized protein
MSFDDEVGRIDAAALAGRIRSCTRRWRSGRHGGMVAVMDQVLASCLPEVAAICRRHRVARLEVFGSAARQAHGAADLDFLVEFGDLPADAYADAYFGLLADLEALFERPVDLVMASAVRNPFVVEAIERSRILLHAA